MPNGQKRFGTDMRLLRNLNLTKSSRDPGNDLSARHRGDSKDFDLETITEVDNLSQALLLRFLTERGELTLLGHPDYGSRLFVLIGELNSETNRNRAKLFVLEALQAEPRVREIRSVIVTQNRADRTRMDIKVSLLAVDSDTLINLVFPFFLEGGAQA
jgi:phage baseplate assembly protein W